MLKNWGRQKLARKKKSEWWEIAWKYSERWKILSEKKTEKEIRNVRNGWKNWEYQEIA